MTRSRKHRSSKRGLVKTATKDIKNIGSKTVSVTEKGVSGIYNFFTTGFNNATKGAKKIMTKRNRSRKHRKSHK